MRGIDIHSTYQQLRLAYDALIVSYDRLQNHHGLYLLRQLAKPDRFAPAASPQPTTPAHAAQHHLPETGVAKTAWHMPVRMMANGAARYYAEHLYQGLEALHQQTARMAELAMRFDDVKRTQINLTSDLMRRQRGPSPAQMISESERLILRARTLILPLVSTLIATAESDAA